MSSWKVKFEQLDAYMNMCLYSKYKIVFLPCISPSQNKPDSIMQTVFKGSVTCHVFSL